MKSKRSLEGYLLIDNRLAPRVPSFHGTPEIPAGASYESATITCSHCHTVVILNPDRTRPRNYCGKCDHYVCDRPGCNLECRPFNATLDRLQAEAARIIL